MTTHLSWLSRIHLDGTPIWRRVFFKRIVVGLIILGTLAVPPIKLWTRLNWWENFRTLTATTTPPLFKFCGWTYIPEGITISATQLKDTTYGHPFMNGADGTTGLLRVGTTPGGTAIVAQELIDSSGWPICRADAFVQESTNTYVFYYNPHVFKNPQSST